KDLARSKDIIYLEEDNTLKEALKVCINVVMLHTFVVVYRKRFPFCSRKKRKKGSVGNGRRV
ncbi:hypothetical protein OFN63_36870, partial [Escherichia coli]|nr:hypothetical protein [Escherichia coli]